MTGPAPIAWKFECRLCRNPGSVTSAVEATASGHGVLFYDGDPLTSLRQVGSGGEPVGAGTDDDPIELITHQSGTSLRRMIQTPWLLWLTYM